MTQPVLIGKLLNYFNPNGHNVTELKHAYFYATGLLLNISASIILHRYAQLEVNHCGMMIQIACSSAIFKKVCKLENKNIIMYKNKNYVQLVYPLLVKCIFLFRHCG